MRRCTHMTHVIVPRSAHVHVYDEIVAIQLQVLPSQCTDWPTGTAGPGTSMHLESSEYREETESETEVRGGERRRVPGEYSCDEVKVKRNSMIFDMSTL